MPNSMSCSPVDGRGIQIINIQFSCECVCVCGCVSDSRGLLLRLRMMNMNSSTVAMAARIIPPMAAPITAGYALKGGSAVKHHSYPSKAAHLN